MTKAKRKARTLKQVVLAKCEKSKNPMWVKSGFDYAMGIEIGAKFAAAEIRKRLRKLQMQDSHIFKDHPNFYLRVDDAIDCTKWRKAK